MKIRLQSYINRFTIENVLQELQFILGVFPLPLLSFSLATGGRRYILPVLFYRLRWVAFQQTPKPEFCFIHGSQIIGSFIVALLA